ncbi:tetratricopeptide repeat protein [Lysobacter sp. Root604]|uniref:tetratricopeptide repeat protein n=1 Tax=Lysobacter sp. Root604 TaxID=1736568 RepID=UPI00138F329A|nr:tetratricopeptide repeat protein [Lysobacter sp. Root604]
MALASDLGAPISAEPQSSAGDSSTGKLYTSPQTAEALTRALGSLDAWEGDSQDLSRARRALEDVLRRDPESAGGHRAIARYHIMRGYLSGERYEPAALDMAERSLDKAIELAPEYADAYVLRGNLYYLMKRPAAARQALDKAEALGSRSPWLYLNRADLMQSEGRYDEATALYQSIADKKTASPKERGAAYGGLIGVHYRAGRYDEVDRAYQASLALMPKSAWEHGNYAAFLLCSKDDYEAAIAQYRQALALMSYGAAREGLQASLQRKWVAQVLEGSDQEALVTRSEMGAASGDRSTAVLADVCKVGPTVGPRIRAGYKVASLKALSPAEAIRLAAGAPEGELVEGVFEFEVIGTGRDQGDTFLNSQADYRDPATLTVRMGRRAADGFRAKYRFDPDLDLRGKRIQVAAGVMRVKISMLKDGIRTGQFYYQTQVLVGDASQIVVVE